MKTLLSLAILLLFLLGGGPFLWDQEDIRSKYTVESTTPPIVPDDGDRSFVTRGELRAAQIKTADQLTHEFRMRQEDNKIRELLVLAAFALVSLSIGLYAVMRTT